MNFNITQIRVQSSLVAIMLLWLNPAVPAQQPQPEASPPTRPSLFRTISGDAGHVLTAPLRLSSTDGIKAGLFGVITAGLIFYADESWDEEFGVEGHHQLLEPLRTFTKPGKWYDDASTLLFFGGLSASMLAGGVATRNHKLLETTRMMCESFVLTQMIMVASKHLIGRSRPFNNEGPREFHFFRMRTERAYHSMPSSHTASIFSMMTVIAKQYPQWWIRYPAYTLSLSVALERADSRNHWASDIWVGGVVGYCVGNLLVKRSRQNGGHFAVSPALSFQRMGVSVRF